MKIPIAILVLCWASAAPALSQSLSELAEKEKERRKGKPAKVITENELRTVEKGRGNVSLASGAPAAGPETSTSPAPAGGAEREKTDEELRAEEREKLQKEMDAHSQRIAEIGQLKERAQLELNDLGNYTYGPRRAEIQKKIDDGNAEIARIRQGMSDLEEQARRKGIALSR